MALEILRLGLTSNFTKFGKLQFCLGLCVFVKYCDESRVKLNRFLPNGRSGSQLFLNQIRNLKGH